MIADTAQEDGFIPKEQIIHSALVYEGRCFAVESAQVRMGSDGELHDREWMRHSGGAAIVACHQGKICLVKQWRQSAERYFYEIPAGRRDPGEEFIETAARELEEETGYRASRLEWILEIYGSPGCTDERTNIYLAHGLEQRLQILDPGEYLRADWYPICDVLTAIEHGSIHDAKTVAGILAAQRHGYLDT